MSDGRRLFRVRRPAQLDSFHVEILVTTIKWYTPTKPVHACTYIKHGSAAHTTDSQGVGSYYLIFHSPNSRASFAVSSRLVGLLPSFNSCSHTAKLHRPRFGWVKHVLFPRANAETLSSSSDTRLFFDPWTWSPFVQQHRLLEHCDRHVYCD